MVLDQFVDCLDEFGDFCCAVDFVRAHELNHIQNTVHDFVLVGSNITVT